MADLKRALEAGQRTPMGSGIASNVATPLKANRCQVTAIFGDDQAVTLVLPRPALVLDVKKALARELGYGSANQVQLSWHDGDLFTALQSTDVLCTSSDLRNKVSLFGRLQGAAMEWDRVPAPLLQLPLRSQPPASRAGPALQPQSPLQSTLAASLHQGTTERLEEGGSPEPRTPVLVDVVVQHATDGNQVRLTLRSTATVWDVKEALMSQLGRRDTSQVLIGTGKGNSFVAYRDADVVLPTEVEKSRSRLVNLGDDTERKPQCTLLAEGVAFPLFAAHGERSELLRAGGRSSDQLSALAGADGKEEDGFDNDSCFEDSPSTSRSPSRQPQREKLWQVVGGNGTNGGLLVRESYDLGSAAHPQRLATGSVVVQLQYVGTRLKYRLEEGTGPQEGWVTTAVPAKTLLVPLQRRMSDTQALHKLLLRHVSQVSFDEAYEVPDKGFRTFGDEHPSTNGGMAKVFVARHKGTGEYRAVKHLTLAKDSDLARVEEEVKILAKLDHPHIMQFHESFLNHEDRSVYLITELCEGGTFVDYFQGVLRPLEDVRVLFRDVLTAVKYCHQHGVVHSDIRCSNCLVWEDINETGRICAKLVDFDVMSVADAAAHAVVIDESDKPERLPGSAFNRAPELLQRGSVVEPKTEMFSIGVMLFLVLSGKHPFHSGGFGSPADFDQETPGMYSKLSFVPLAEEDVPDQSQDLVRRLLSLQAQHRLDAKAALDHEWLRPGPANRDVWTRQDSHAEEAMLLTRACNFRNMGRFHVAMLRLIAHHSQEADVALVRESFESFDQDQNGTLSRAELRDAVNAAGLGSTKLGDLQEFDAAFRALDVHGDGEVSYSTWLAATLPPTVVAKPSAMRDIFSFLDTAKSGLVTHSGLKQVFGEETATIVRAATKSDSLTFQQFEKLMQKLAAKHVNCE